MAKACLQLIVVGFIGGLLTAAVQHFQQGRNIRLDERRREDEFLRSMLGRTVSAYNAVKRIRRFLDAETRNESGVRSISRATYDQYLTELNAQQLEFESLKRIAPLADQRISRNRPTVAGPAEYIRDDSLTSMFSRVESFLNQVVGEYQHRRYLVPASGEISLNDFVALDSFFRKATFTAGTSDNINVIVRVMQTALLTP